MASSSFLISLLIKGLEENSISNSDPVSHEGENLRDPLLGTSEGSRYGLRLFNNTDFLMSQEDDLWIVTFYTFLALADFSCGVLSGFDI